MSRQVMLTTKDNPVDPFDDFDEWFNQDIDLARRNSRPDTCGLLARLSTVPIGNDEFLLTEQEKDDEIERAIDDIVSHDVLNIYVKVVRDVDD